MSNINEKNISNKHFWKLWKKGLFEEALKYPVKEKEENKNRIRELLGGTSEQTKQTANITLISAGEFIYDHIMINPAVVRGLDFSRTEDLSSLFTLSQFAETIDTTTLSGDMAQIQGYVAEYVLAAELQAKGYDVEFPGTANNPGWDLLIDGQEFQVKNLADPNGVRDHLQNYPDIPVYVNEEIGEHFEGDSRVYISNISHEEVIEKTASTLDYAGDVMNFEIPIISAGVSTFYNIKRVWKDDILIKKAVFNVISDTSSRVILGAMGQKAGVIVGLTLFGPAGGVTGAMFGAYAGVSQGGKLSTTIRKMTARKQENEVKKALEDLIQKVAAMIEDKLRIKNRKLKKVKEKLKVSEAAETIWQEIHNRHNKEFQYINNRKQDLILINSTIQRGSRYVLDEIPHIMSVIIKSGVHPSSYQTELEMLQEKTNLYSKSI